MRWNFNKRNKNKKKKKLVAEKAREAVRRKPAVTLAKLMIKKEDSK